MTRPVGRALTLFVVLAAALVIASVVYTVRQTALGPPLPTPNGFDDLVEAAHRITGDYADLKSLESEPLQTAVTQDAEAIRVAKRGLSRNCQVPLPTTSANWTNHGGKLVGLRALASAFAAEGKLAERQGRNLEAAEAYLNVVRLAHESARGGILIHGLISISMEPIGETRLQKLLPNLDAKTCRAAAIALETIESRRETVETVLQQERRWVRHACGVRGTA